MNLNLQRGAGRGEYELSGRQGDLRPENLFDLPIFVETVPGVTFNAYSKCLKENGKPRIRLTPKMRNAHLSPLIAAAMLLPKPRRVRNETHGIDLLRWDDFALQSIRLDVAMRVDKVLLRPLTVRLENGDDKQLDIDFAERMSRVVRVWAAANDAVDAVANAVQAHCTAFTSSTTAQSVLANALAKVRTSLGKPDGDLLPLLEARFGLGESSSPLAAGIYTESSGDFDADVHVEPAQVLIERARRWRLAALRGKSAAGFRRDVREAYDYQCLFSGQRLPRTDETLTAGVDAAHILPWSRFDLDTVKNGVCLSKHCHWAFDEGLLRLTFDQGVNSYVVSIPHAVRAAAKVANFDLGFFEAVAKPIPKIRLPKNEAQWPSNQYLGDWNRYLDGGLVWTP